MKILSDSNIPQVATLFAPYGEVSFCPGREMTPRLLRDVDVLLVRSVTSVDHRLLSDSELSFVGSATIGTDHIDHDYLARRNIEFAHAPGCNANAVVQYVIAVLCASVPAWRDKTVGIIGCGQVGGRLLACLQALGLDCKVYDPLLDATACPVLVDFPEAMAADIVCVHTPLTKSGPFPTYHMIDQAVLEAMRPETLLINAGRGAVIDNKALLQLLKDGKPVNVVLDVWEGEPAISLELLQKVLLGTPHIAGHSVEGKLRGTQMLLEAFCRWRGDALPVFAEAVRPLPLSARGLVGAQAQGRSVLDSLVLQVYDPGEDHQDMRRALDKPGSDLGKRFDKLRRSYKQRWEFSHYDLSNVPDDQSQGDLEVLGFSIS